MEKEKLKEQVERFKAKAELFLKSNTRVFIKDINVSYYFCDILIIGEDTLLVNNFAGNRTGTHSKLFWIDIISLEEYKPKEETQ